MLQTASRLWRDESGQDLIEYALLAGLVAVVAATLPFQSTMGLLTQIYAKVSAVLVRFGG